MHSSLLCFSFSLVLSAIPSHKCFPVEAEETKDAWLRDQHCFLELEGAGGFSIMKYDSGVTIRIRSFMSLS